MTLEITILQHAEKIRLPGDHGLTERGCAQARAAGLVLAMHDAFHELWCSTLRRSRETAELVADCIGMPRKSIQEDVRVAERINWWSAQDQTMDEFQRDWERSTIDREFEPRFGDSSRAAGDRFAAFLSDLQGRTPNGRVLVVSHGGVTTDLARTWFSDQCVNHLALGAIEHGVPNCAITRIKLDGAQRTLLALGVPLIEHE